MKPSKPASWNPPSASSAGRYRRRFPTPARTFKLNPSVMDCEPLGHLSRDLPNGGRDKPPAPEKIRFLAWPPTTYLPTPCHVISK